MSGTVLVAEAPPPEQTEAVADAAVEVAAIEAARDVSIAEIQAEVASEAIEAEAEQSDEDVEWLRAELADLRASRETHAGILSRLETELAEARQQIQSLTETMVTQAALSLLTPPSLLETPESAEANSPESVAVPEAPAPEPTRGGIRKRVWLR